MRNPEKILLTAKREKRAATASFLIVAALFLLATAQTQFQPFEFLMSMENFWLFIFEDLLPPKIADFGAIAEGILQTVCMAIAASMISAVISLAFAFLGSNTTAPWKPLKKIIRFFASLQRNIPSMIWTFLLIMAFGIGTVVGALALLITTCGFLIRSFIETIDEVGGESLEALQAVGAGRLTTITQVIIPASLPGFLSWLLYSLEVNIRSSTLVGAVGGGGIGLVMMGYIKQFRYHSAMGVILLIAGIVILVDMLTNFLRKKVLA